MHILYVEDEPNERTLVVRFMQTGKYDLAVARDADEARAAVQRRLPDMILMDVLLGHTRDGFKLAREFRDQGFNGPMIAVTGLTTADDYEQCRKVGFTDVLHKPFTLDQLAQKIRQYAV
jgi:DNA-binding response OmpR family regulator